MGWWGGADWLPGWLLLLPRAASLGDLVSSGVCGQQRPLPAAAESGRWYFRHLQSQPLYCRGRMPGPFACIGLSFWCSDKPGSCSLHGPCLLPTFVNMHACGIESAVDRCSESLLESGLLLAGPEISYQGRGPRSQITAPKGKTAVVCAKPRWRMLSPRPFTQEPPALVRKGQGKFIPPPPPPVLIFSLHSRHPVRLSLTLSQPSAAW